MEFVDTYLYSLQKTNASSLKIWYKDLLANKINMISVICNAENLSACIEAINTLICKSGLIGLDYLEAFHYMGGESEVAYFNEYSIRQDSKGQIAIDIENVKAFGKSAKSGVVLIDGWYTLLEAQEILKLLEWDDMEIAYQVHADESKKNGKLYIWTSNKYKRY